MRNYLSVAVNIRAFKYLWECRVGFSRQLKLNVKLKFCYVLNHYHFQSVHFWDCAPLPSFQQSPLPFCFILSNHAIITFQWVYFLYKLILVDDSIKLINTMWNIFYLRLESMRWSRLLCVYAIALCSCLLYFHYFLMLW